MEENANLVVRLLIRRPECLGPALRGEGGGLLKGMTGSIVMSLQIVAARDQDTRVFLRAVTEMKDDDRGDYLQQRYCHAPTLAGHSAIRPPVCPRVQLPRRRLHAAEVLSFARPRGRHFGIAQSARQSVPWRSCLGGDYLQQRYYHAPALGGISE